MARDLTSYRAARKRAARIEARHLTIERGARVPWMGLVEKLQAPPPKRRVERVVQGPALKPVEPVEPVEIERFLEELEELKAHAMTRVDVVPV